MKMSVKLQGGMRVMAGAFLLFLILATGLFSDAFSMIAHADSTGKVTAESGAKIRKEASTASESVGSAEHDSEWSIKGQTTAADGHVWYQVSVDGTTGYIRSDLMSITDGSTPPSIVGSTTTQPAGSSTPTTSTPDETLVDVAEVEPVSASVSGNSRVRVRQNASTTSRIVATAPVGAALTVTGTAVGTDGNEWLRVNFTSGSSEVQGFIRANYVAVNGELVPADSGEAPVGDPQPEVGPPQPEQTKDWDTFYADDKWHLQDNVKGNSYDIDKIFESVESNTETLKETFAKNRNQQIIIVILVILLICMAGTISFLIFKLKDMADSAYFNEVERETARRRTADRPVERSQSGARTAQNGSGANRYPAGGNGQRPTGGRPAGARPAESGGNGQRPTGGRPAESGGNGQRPTGARPSGARPAESGGNGQRPAGARPSGARPAESGGNGQRPAGARPADARESARPRQGQAPERASDYERNDAYEAPAQESSSAQPRQKGGWKSKNFINDDEFEFQFLDWEEDRK